MRICDRDTNEVCVCSTGSCASPDRDCLEGDGTGYRYRERPFAADGLAGDCVSSEDMKSAIEQDEDTLLCEEDSEPSPDPDSAPDASTGSNDASTPLLSTEGGV